MKTSPDYDRIAEDYDRRFEFFDDSRVTKLVLGFACSESSLRFLDLGCGTGHWLARVSSRVQSSAGLDLSMGMLEHAKAKLFPKGESSLEAKLFPKGEPSSKARLFPNAEPSPAAKPSHCVLARGRAEGMPWKDATFDRILINNAFHHFRDKERAMAEARRVLRPGGGLLIIGLDPHTGLDRWWIHDYFGSSLATDKGRYLPTDRMRALMKQCGLSRCETVLALHEPICFSARIALEEGRLEKHTTSQLALLTDEEYEQGMRRLWGDIEASEAVGAERVLLSDLRLYATTGWL